MSHMHSSHRNTIEQKRGHILHLINAGGGKFSEACNKDLGNQEGGIRVGAGSNDKGE